MGWNKRIELFHFQDKNLSPEAFILFKKKLEKESFIARYFYKKLSATLKDELEQLKKELDIYVAQIDSLKKKRKIKSASLQAKIFEQYQFLNKEKIPKALTEIFPNNE